MIKRIKRILTLRAELYQNRQIKPKPQLKDLQAYAKRVKQS